MLNHPAGPAAAAAGPREQSVAADACRKPHRLTRVMQQPLAPGADETEAYRLSGPHDRVAEQSERLRFDMRVIAPDE